MNLQPGTALKIHNAIMIENCHCKGQRHKHNHIKLDFSKKEKFLIYYIRKLKNRHLFFYKSKIYERINNLEDFIYEIY